MIPANFQAVVTLVQKAVSQPDFELEARVGTLDVDKFSAGFRSHDKVVFERLYDELQRKVNESSHWISLTPVRVTMMRVYYTQQLRRTICPGSPETYCEKRLIQSYNFHTCRPYDLRVSLHHERDVEMTELHPQFEEVQRKAPQCVRLMQRASFLESVSAPVDHADWNLQFRYDLSLVGTGVTKLAATKAPARFHVEVEWVFPAQGMTNPSEITPEFVTFATEAFIQRSHALLGTHRKVGGQLVPLPPLTCELVSHPTRHVLVE